MGRGKLICESTKTAQKGHLEALEEEKSKGGRHGTRKVAEDTGLGIVAKDTGLGIVAKDTGLG